MLRGADSSGPSRGGAIDLDRRFITYDPELVPLAAWVRASRSAMSWEELLTHGMVVVLGDAGAGKSTELLQQKLRLEAEGRRAFFASVKEVNQTSADVLFASTDLQGWLVSDEPAHFFLDAIDEARLQQLNIEHVLRTFLAQVGAARGALHLVLSCRPADWRGEADARALTSLRSFHGQQAEPPMVVSMVGLDWDRARRLVVHRGVTDPEPIRAALESDGREFLLENPRDVGLVADWWKAHGAVGSFFDMLDAAITARLTGPPRRGAHVTPDEARQGAMTMAAIGVLANEVRFDTMSDGANVIGVDPRRALSGWSDDQIADLLVRGAFVPDGSAAVRMFHRSAHELLAAQWFLQKLRQGAPRSLVFRVLLARDPAWPSMLRPTASWVAVRDQELAHRLEKSDPLSLILFGDPGSLPVARREAVLRAAVAGEVPETIDDAALRRFWHPDLRAVLADLAKGSLKHPVASLVCQLGAIGDVIEVAPLARDLALDDTAPRHLRVDAIRSLAALRAHEHELAAWATRIRDEQDLLGATVDAIFPGHLTLGDLAVSLDQATFRIKDSVSVLSMALTQRLPLVAAEDRNTWLQRANLAAAPSGNMKWLMMATAKSLKEENFGPALSAVCDMLVLHMNFDVERDVGDLVSGWPALRRELFWRRVANHRTAKPRRPARRIGQVEGFASDPRLRPDDKTWLADDSLERTDVIERLLAFDALAPLCTNDELASIAAKDAALRKRLERSQNPRVDWTVEGSLSMHRRHDRWLEVRRLRERNQLLAIAPDIAAGQHLHALLHLLSIAGRHDAAPEIAKVTERYGAEIAEAFSKGLRAYWAYANLPRVYERGAQNSIPGEVILAEGAVHYDAANSPGLSRLSAAAAAQAVRIALWMSNRLPEWVTSAVLAHPQTVQSEIEPVLRAEIALGAGDHSYNVFRKISRAAQELRRACYATIEQLLLAHHNTRADVLEEALEAAFAAPQANLVAIGRRIVPLVTLTGPLDTLVVAWCGWLHIEPAKAASWLSSNVAALPNAAAVVLLICDRLRWWLDQHSAFEHRLRTSPQALALLLPVLFAYVDPAHDLPIRGVIGDRQSAQMFRDALLRLIESMSSSDADDATRALIAHPAMRPVRTGLEMRVHRSKATALTMTVPQATVWAQGLVDEPTNALQLFELACARLEDIRSELEEGEFGYGDALVPSRAAPSSRTDEYRFQRWLAAQLKMLAGHAYAVVREPEVKDKKRPDLRLEKAGLTPTSIEIKVAESWTLQQLRDALEFQLCGQYLSNVHSRHGVLVLCSVRDKVWDGGEKLPDVVDALRTLAAALAARAGYELRVVVLRFWAP